MRSRAELLSVRRHALIAQSEALRAQLQTSTAQLERSLGLVQIAASAVRSLGRNPAVLVGGAVALVAVGPRRAAKLFAVGFGLWSLLSRMRGLAGNIARLVRAVR